MRLARPRCATATCQPAGRARSTWRSALLSVQPDTLLRWHRQLFRRFWRRKSPSAASGRGPTGTAETIARIRAMAAANALLGAERIRGERRKLDIRVAQWTVQKDLGGGRPPRRTGQTWATFLRNQADDIWACDFLPVTDLLFRVVL